jgi:ParB-like chromosome segregation protein Spo0J
MKTFTTLREVAESKDVSGAKLFPGISKSASFRVAPRLVHIDYDNLIRPIDQEHVEQFKTAILAGAVIPPIFVKWVFDELVVYEGNHRVTAYVQLIDEGFEIQSIEAIEFKGSDVDAIALMLTSSQGKPLTPLEAAHGYKKLIGFGWSQKQIAERTGKTIAHVSKMLQLTTMGGDIQAMVKRGEVSASVALAKVKKHGKDAKTTLANDICKAKETGKKKVTGKSLNDAAYPESVSLMFKEICEKAKAILIQIEGNRYKWSAHSFDETIEILVLNGFLKLIAEFNGECFTTSNR